MADTMQVELVSPERRLARIDADEVRIPTAEGDMTAMSGHEPTITTLRPGVLRIVHSGGTDEYVVSGGFAEIGAREVSILAEQALPRGEVTQEIYDRMLEEASRAHATARENASADEPGAVEETAKLLADMVGMGHEIGLSPRQPNL